MGTESPIIDSRTLRSILAEAPNSIVLLDVREPEEFAEDRLPGGKLIPLGELMARARAELDPESDLVVYCAHGVRSMYARTGLLSLGFGRVRSLAGGLCDYRETE